MLRRFVPAGYDNSGMSKKHPDNRDRTWKPRTKTTPFAKIAESSSITAKFYASPDWSRLRSALMAALADHPEARESVIRTLQALLSLEHPNV